MPISAEEAGTYLGYTHGDPAGEPTLYFANGRYTQNHSDRNNIGWHPRKQGIGIHRYGNITAEASTQIEDLEDKIKRAERGRRRELEARYKLLIETAIGSRTADEAGNGSLFEFYVKGEEINSPHPSRGQFIRVAGEGGGARGANPRFDDEYARGVLARGQEAPKYAAERTKANLRRTEKAKAKHEEDEAEKRAAHRKQIAILEKRRGESTGGGGGGGGGGGDYSGGNYGGAGYRGGGHGNVGRGKGHGPVSRDDRDRDDRDRARREKEYREQRERDRDDRERARREREYRDYREQRERDRRRREDAQREDEREDKHKELERAKARLYGSSSSSSSSSSSGGGAGGGGGGSGGGRQKRERNDKGGAGGVTKKGKF